MNKDDLAIEQYKQYIAAYPENPNAYANLGAIYDRQNNTDLAVYNYVKITFKGQYKRRG